MTKLTIYIVEDDALYGNQLMMIIDEIGYELAGISDNSDTAIKEIKSLKPDLILADININGTMDGLELVLEVQKARLIPVIFITSFDDQDTFNRSKMLHTAAFITKPIDTKALQRAIDLAFSRIHNKENDKNTSNENKDIALNEAFFIKLSNKLIRINYQDISYLEIEDKYCTVHTLNNRKFVLRMSMGDVMKKLIVHNFYRIHRKYSVNLNVVTSINLQANVLFLNDISLPISRASKEDLLSRLDWLQ